MSVPQKPNVIAMRESMEIGPDGSVRYRGVVVGWIKWEIPVAWDFEGEWRQMGTD